MNLQCPHCQSPRVASRNVAKKAGGLIGSVGGAASGAAGALNGARFGGMVGVVGGASGGMAGAKLGELVDDRMLDNCQCLDCGHRFSAQPS